VKLQNLNQTIRVIAEAVKSLRNATVQVFKAKGKSKKAKDEGLKRLSSFFIDFKKI
jgi:hypothetical protein